MVRIFSFLAAIIVTMILIAGWGVYWMSWFEVENAKKESETVIAKGTALGIEAQINLLNEMLDKMAQDPDVLLAVTRADSEGLNSAAVTLERHLPEALKVRLLLPNVSELDNTGAPRMGFADLGMAQETLTKNALPAIQGDVGSDRHLAIARKIIYNDKVIGIILASLRYDFIAKTLQAAATQGHYIELKQGTLVLGAAGDKKNRKSGESLQLRLSNTDWTVDYHSASGNSLGDWTLLISIITIPLLVSILAMFVAYRKLSDALSQDLRSVIQAFKDLMGSKLQGSYPVQLNEMNAVISNLVQFKRVLANEGKNKLSAKAEDDFDLNIALKDEDGFELDDFFNDPSDSKR
jgi:phosphomannomutase/phosphoglucomutase